MSILDDAIREHLELKRAHGADESELKRLEDEAFGPPQRPDEIDASAEAPTEFLTAPSEVVEEAAAEIEKGRRNPNIADLQEAPPAPSEEPPSEEGPPAPPEEPAAEKASAAPEEPAVEEQPAAEHQLPEPPVEKEQRPDGVHTTEEREAIASQPTEMFDVPAELDVEAEPAASEAEDDDEFFSEQRLSDELNQALEAPVGETEEHELPPLPEPPSEDPVTEAPAAPVTEEGTAIYDAGEDVEEDEEYEEEDSREENVYEPETGSHDDVLEDTPDFLEEGDADDAWFEQRPPKDFDFDD